MISLMTKIQGKTETKRHTPSLDCWRRLMEPVCKTSSPDASKRHVYTIYLEPARINRYLNTMEYITQGPSYPPVANKSQLTSMRKLRRSREIIPSDHLTASNITGSHGYGSVKLRPPLPLPPPRETRAMFVLSESRTYLGGR